MAIDRQAKVQVINDTNEDIFDVVLIHKHSNVSKEKHAWDKIERRNHGSSKMVAYQTGTKGLDWWVLLWKVRRGDLETVYISNPHNLRKLADFIEKYCDTAIKAATGALAIVSAVDPELITKVISGALSLTGALASMLINGEETEGFKEHMLTTKDSCEESARATFIRIGTHDNPDKKVISFESPSGISTTNYTEVGDIPATITRLL